MLRKIEKYCRCARLLSASGSSSVTANSCCRYCHCCLVPLLPAALMYLGLVMMDCAQCVLSSHAPEPQGKVCQHRCRLRSPKTISSHAHFSTSKLLVWVLHAFSISLSLLLLFLSCIYVGHSELCGLPALPSSSFFSFWS